MRQAVIADLQECVGLVHQLRERLGPIMIPTAPREDRILPLDKSVVAGCVGELRGELELIVDRLEL